eukprot:1169713-Pyramimonas_sp.AAC.1
MEWAPMSPEAKWKLHCFSETADLTLARARWGGPLPPCPQGRSASAARTSPSLRAPCAPTARNTPTGRRTGPPAPLTHRDRRALLAQALLLVGDLLGSAGQPMALAAAPLGHWHRLQRARPRATTPRPRRR